MEAGRVRPSAGRAHAGPGHLVAYCQNSDVIYPGRVLRFLPPEMEKAWGEARSAHSGTAYAVAEVMCLPGQ